MAGVPRHFKIETVAGVDNARPPKIHLIPEYPAMPDIPDYTSII